MIEQRTIRWYRIRLGKITGSRVGDIIGVGKGAPFTKTGLSYLQEVAAEIMIPNEIKQNDELLQQYIDETDITSKAMRIGTDRELEARELYSVIFNIDVDETGSTRHPSIYGFASSPDGIIYAPDGREVEGVIEIKCPKPATYMAYLCEIRCAADLKKVKEAYYWQCMSHLAVTGAKWCDFVAYCPYNKVPLHRVRIERDEAAIQKLEDRVSQAIDWIGDAISKL